MELNSETLEKAKKIGIGVGVIILFGVFIQIVFDNSGQPNQPTELPKNIVEAPVESQPDSEKLTLEKVSEIRKQGWKQIKQICGENFKIDAENLNEEIRIARAQQWIQQSQFQSSKNGKPNLEFLEEQFGVYAGRAQAIAQHNGADQLNIASAKTIAEFREYFDTALDISTAIELLGSSNEPRPTVTTVEFKTSADQCLDEINNYGAINEEQLRKAQEAVLSETETAPTEGSAKATGEGSEDDQL